MKDPEVFEGREVHAHVGEWCPLCVRHGIEIAGLEDEDQERIPYTYADVVASVKGTVGTLEGPPIIGTEDRVNAGTARPWRPAGEVGEILESGVSLVVEPKNDARPALKRVGPPRE